MPSKDYCCNASKNVKCSSNIIGEIKHHLPYSIFAVALCLISISLLDYFSFVHHSAASRHTGLKTLFHCFHFLHLVFASTGAIITFLRFSKNIPKAIIVGTVSPLCFCVLSDTILPSIANFIINGNAHFHFCLYSEPQNVLPFLIAGLLNGFAIGYFESPHQHSYSFESHSIHIFISAMASTFFLIMNGFENWYPNMGLIFVFLVVAVALPCTLSDLVIPMIFAKKVAMKNENNSIKECK